jgi:hypothetical protein
MSPPLNLSHQNGEHDLRVIAFDTSPEICRERRSNQRGLKGVGIGFASAHQHDEIARAMENAGWRHAPPCYVCVSFWEAGPKSLNKLPSVSGLLGIPEV